MADIGKAYVQIIPSTRGLKDSLTEQLGGESKTAGKTAGNGIVSMMKKVFITAGIAKALFSTLNEGGKLQQSLGGIETLFKDNADKVKEYAKEAYRTTGLSANAYMENVTGFSASLLQSLGGDTKKAAEISNMAMIDMADNSNKMGTSMEAIQNAYQGFAKQNYTMLDNLKLGYGGTKSEMERLLRDAQKLTGVKYDINNLSDVYQAIHAIQGELGITGTTAKESSSTLTGSFNAMKGAFFNLLGALSSGFGLNESLNGLASTVSTFLFGNLIPMLGNIIVALPGALYTFFAIAIPQFMQMGSEMIQGIINGFTAGGGNFFVSFNEMVKNFTTIILPEFLERGVELINGLVTGLLNGVPNVLSGMGEILNTLLEAIAESFPQLLDSGYELIKNFAVGIFDNLPATTESLTNILDKLLKIIVEHFPKILKKGFELIGKMAMGIWNNLPEIINRMTNLLTSLLRTIANHLPEFLSKGIQLIVEMAVGLVKAIPDIVSKIPGIIKAVLSSIGSFLGEFINIGKNLLLGLADGIVGAVGSVIRRAIDAVGGIVRSVKNFFGIHSPSRVFAEIGMFLDYGLAEGIADNTRPITKAMDEVSNLVTDNFTSDLTYTISSSKPSTNFSDLESTDFKNSINSKAEKTPGTIVFKIGKNSFRALVEDITELQNKETNLELAYI